MHEQPPPPQKKTTKALLCVKIMQNLILIIDIIYNKYHIISYYIPLKIFISKNSLFKLLTVKEEEEKAKTR